MLTLSTTSFLFLFTVNLSDDAALLVLCVIYTKTIYVTVYTPCACFVQTPADLQLLYNTCGQNDFFTSNLFKSSNVVLVIIPVVMVRTLADL